MKNKYLLAVEVAGGKEEELDNTLKKLQILDIVDISEDNIKFSHFSERQYDNPSDQPDKVKERVAKHRAKKKNEKKNTSNDNVTKCNDTDTEADTDTESDTETELKPSASASNAHVDDSTNLPNEKNKEHESFYAAHERVWGFECNPMQAQKLAAYIDQDLMEEDVVIRAIERAAVKGTGYNFGFITKILDDYLDANAKTLTKAIAIDNQFENRRKLNAAHRDGNRGHPPTSGSQAAGGGYYDQFPGLVKNV